MVIVNLREFEKLDKPTQDALSEGGGGRRAQGLGTHARLHRRVAGHLQKNKMTIVKPSPQLMGDMKKIGDEMLSDWLKQAGTDGKEIVDAYRKK